jgi:putative transcriptional regulator
MARVIGASRQTVSSIEAERSEPSLPLAFSIAEAFGLTIEEVFTRPTTKPPWERAPQVAPPR